MVADGGDDSDANYNIDGNINYNAKIADNGDNANIADDDSENTNEILKRMVKMPVRIRLLMLMVMLMLKWTLILLPI